MDLLEYQVVPSLREVVWLWTFTMEKQLDNPSARSWVAPVRTTGTVRKRQAGDSPPASQAGRRVGPALELSASLAPGLPPYIANNMLLSSCCLAVVNRDIVLNSAAAVT
jgi:hypothetical protein